MAAIPSSLLVSPLADLDDAAVLAGLVAPRSEGPARGWSEEALARLGGLRRLASMSPRELSSRLRATPLERSVRVCCAFELGRRRARATLPVHHPVRSAIDLEPHLRGFFDGLLKELFVVVLLDSKNRPLRSERVSEGCLTWSVVHPREVFAPAVRESAGAIIVAHNHPSGDPSPSQQDLDVTARLVRAGETLGIPLLDHVIVGDGRSVSLRALGRLEGWR